MDYKSVLLIFLCLEGVTGKPFSTAFLKVLSELMATLQASGNGEILMKYHSLLFLVHSSEDESRID